MDYRAAFNIYLTQAMHNLLHTHEPMMLEDKTQMDHVFANKSAWLRFQPQGSLGIY